MTATPPTPLRLLDILWGANFIGPLVYAALAFLFGANQGQVGHVLSALPYLLGAVVMGTAVAAHILWRRWLPADLPMHRALARASDLPILRVRLVQVWALDSLAAVFGLALAFIGFPKDIWIWFMFVSAALLFLHHPSHLHLTQGAV